MLVTVIATLVASAVGALAGAAAVVWGGLYDVSAARQHTQAVYSLLEAAMERAVRKRAAAITPPAVPPQVVLQRGAACHRDHCVQCHGAPGVAPGAVGMSMLPLPGPLVDAGQRWRSRELYWITRHGIRMSGMPAWGLRLADDDIWAVVGFIARLPQMSPADYADHLAAASAVHCTLPSGDGTRPSPTMPVPSAERARLALQQYACIACHRIPGMTGSDVHVGPPLQGLAGRRLIAGRIANTPENLVRWIRTPQAVKPGSAMPDLGVTEEHAQLMAAYLWRLH